VRVLVEDEDRAGRDALRRRLSLGGYDVRVAEDGEEALELLVEDISDSLSFAEIRLDPAAQGAWVGERFVELTPTEYRLLSLLVLNPRRVLSHELIYDRVWGYDFGPASNAIRVYVGYLRRKLELAGAGGLIQTVRGFGYVLRER